MLDRYETKSLEFRGFSCIQYDDRTSHFYQLASNKKGSISINEESAKAIDK